MADKLKVDDSTLAYLAGISPPVYDLNSGERMGRWEFTDPVEIEVNPYPFDPNYEIVTFTEEGEQPFKALVSTQDVETIQQTVAEVAPSMDITITSFGRGGYEIQANGMTYSLESHKGPEVLGALGLSDDEQRSLMTIDGRMQTFSVGEQAFEAVKSGLEAKAPEYHTVTAEVHAGGQIAISVDGGEPQLFNTRFNDTVMRAELEALGLDNWHINDIANMTHGDPPNVQEAYSVGELDVEGFNTYNDRLEAAVEQNRIDRAQDRVDQAVEMVADNLDVDGPLTVQRTGAFTFTITDQNGAAVQVAQMHLNDVLEENGHSSILAGVGFGKHQDGQPVVSHSMRIDPLELKPGKISVSEDEAYQERREFHVDGLPEDGASLHQEQANDYGHLRTRCGCGAFTWDEPLADVVVPSAIEPPVYALSEPSSDMAGAYVANLDSLRPDSTMAPVTPEVQQPGMEPVQMALDTTVPAFGGNGFA